MRKSSGWNAVLGLIGSMMQTVIFIMAFYFMFQLMGVRSSPIKGDYMLYIISSITMFMTHNTAVQGVAGAEGPTSGMIQHAPINTMIAVCSAAPQSLYQQTIKQRYKGVNAPRAASHSAAHPLSGAMSCQI